MKRFYVMFCILVMVGCSTSKVAKVEGILADAEARLQAVAVLGGTTPEMKEAMGLLDKAQTAIELGKATEAEDHRAALLLVLDELEKK